MDGERIPEDILETAETRVIPRGLDGNHYRSTLVEYIARALMDERERCAKIADPKTHHARGRMSTDMQKPADIAAAIRKP